MQILIYKYCRPICPDSARAERAAAANVGVDRRHRMRAGIIRYVISILREIGRRDRILLVSRYALTILS